MNDKPIIFSPDMVRAILAGKKTQTRRLVKGFDRIIEKHGFGLNFRIKGNRLHVFNDREESRKTEITQYPLPWVPGQKLWVRETWLADKDGNPIYLADHSPSDTAKIARKFSSKGRWGRSLYMPKKFARIWLEVVNVNVQHIKSMFTHDIISEGFRFNSWDISPIASGRDNSAEWAEYRTAFYRYVDMVNHRPEGWTEEHNPLVWAIEFKRL